MSVLQLPELDLGDFRAGGVTREAFLTKLRAAARDVGFFYLSGHGVSAKLEADLKAQALQFFALPEADKLAIEMVHSPHFRGYTRAGRELTRGQQDWREQIDVGSELQAIADTADAPWLRLKGPNLWPAALPDFRPVVLEWQKELTARAIELLEAFALALGQPSDVFAPIYRKAPNEHLKLIRYPGRDATQSDQGVGAHKDSGFLTLLLQDDIGGLQVQAADGSWIDATPRPGTFVVNIGEILELASNGYLRATVHRVVTPPAGKERISIAYFLGADVEATVPLLQLAPDLAAEATGPTSDPANPLFKEVGRNYLKGRLRSHPDVAQRHYADLL
jgi:isopenicillin N synthase-like dioxygenase